MYKVFHGKCSAETMARKGNRPTTVFYIVKREAEKSGVALTGRARSFWAEG